MNTMSRVSRPTRLLDGFNLLTLAPITTPLVADTGDLTGSAARLGSQRPGDNGVAVQR